MVEGDRRFGALAVDGEAVWVVSNGAMVWRWSARGGLVHWGEVPGGGVTCVGRAGERLAAGTKGAHVWWSDAGSPDGAWTQDAGFEEVEGRDAWSQPFGGPADARSIAVDAEGRVFLNVHVGGVPRMETDGSWAPTIEVADDGHEVAAHPTRPGVLAVAAAEGLGLSEDHGETWTWHARSMHAHYARAVAWAGDTVLVSVARWVGDQQSGLYRLPPGDDAPIRCTEGLPEHFAGHIDSGCIAAQGDDVVIAQRDGMMWRSADAGVSWVELPAIGVPVRAGALARPQA